MRAFDSGSTPAGTDNPESHRQALELARSRDRTLAIVMAGGVGTRLGDLTRRQCKPALMFGGQYKNIDFPLSNCVNSGIRKIAILTQYESHALIKHLQAGWGFFRPELGEFLELWPAQQRDACEWYAGTADAVFQNLHIVEEHAPEHALILAGDHVYAMDYGRMIEAHLRANADVTVGCVEVPIAEAKHFGVLSVDKLGWINRFLEKPSDPRPMPGKPGFVLASMGIYVFKRAFLMERLAADARDSSSAHDFGRDIVPGAIASGARVLSHRFVDGRTNQQGYWRDVGTIDAYWQANMDLLADAPSLDLNDESWPMWTHQEQLPPAKLAGNGTARRSILSGGCVIAGAVDNSVIGTRCTVGEGSMIEQSVVMPGAHIGRQCRIYRAIVDSGCEVPDGTVIGDVLTQLGAYQISPQGIALVTADALTGEKAMRERSVA